MKQTIRTSRTAGQLEKMFRAINAHFYNNELPEPIITLKKTPNAYGHITCSKTWQAGSERRYEINISTATRWTGPSKKPPPHFATSAPTSTP